MIIKMSNRLGLIVSISVFLTGLYVVFRNVSIKPLMCPGVSCVVVTAVNILILIAFAIYYRKEQLSKKIKKNNRSIYRALRHLLRKQFRDTKCAHCRNDLDVTSEDLYYQYCCDESIVHKACGDFHLDDFMKMRCYTCLEKCKTSYLLS